VVGADLAKEHLENALLLFVGHDWPVVDDGLESLTLYLRFYVLEWV
jgi:hypothetical protein